MCNIIVIFIHLNNEQTVQVDPRLKYQGRCIDAVWPNFFGEGGDGGGA